MNILFCRIGQSISYNGNVSDKPKNGGEYNKAQIGHEIHNYLGYKGKYYGYVQSTNDIINIQKLGGINQDDFAKNVLVVWVSTKKNVAGQYIVGWYKNAIVYKNHQQVPAEAMAERKLKDHDFYNVLSENVLLLPPEERVFPIVGMGQSNVWYGNEATNKQVEDYVNKYSSNYDNRIKNLEAGTSTLKGDEKDAVVKVRINQDKFRNGLINKYGKCCLCGMSNEKLLIASHLKPWAASDCNEKLDLNNGLLLCPNHDKLIDSGLISFSQDGKIIISDLLNSEDRILMNINENMEIEINEENSVYVEYHRKNIFINK